MTGPVSVKAGWTSPHEMPAVGQVLALSGTDMQYRNAPLRLRVARVRLDISGWYDGKWVWLEGHELDADGYPINWQQLLVSVAAVGAQSRDTSDAGLRSTPGSGT